MTGAVLRSELNVREILAENLIEFMSVTPQSSFDYGSAKAAVANVWCTMRRNGAQWLSTLRESAADARKLQEYRINRCDVAIRTKASTLASQVCKLEPLRSTTPLLYSRFSYTIS